MIRSQHDYEQIYTSRPWAYGDKPDPELIKALVGVPRGRALDVGGGQGRHAMALAELGFDVTVVDSAPTGLHQVAVAADERGVSIRTVQQDVSKYQPEAGLTVIVAALFFHIPAHKTSLKTAETLGAALATDGLLYISLPGFTPETETFARELIASSGCKEMFVVKHLVTKKERPRLPVPRRNETRALAVRS